MKTATKAPAAFLRTSFTETLFFTSKPDAQTRRALREAGWKWNRAGHWFRNQNQTGPVKARDMGSLLAPANDNEPDSNDVIAAALA